MARPLNPRGRFIALVGADGVGKTTTAKNIIRLEDGPTMYVHFRPSLSGPIPAAPPDEQAPPVDKVPEAGPIWLGWFRLARSLFLFWLVYLLRLRPALRRGTLVIADRWGYGYVGQPRALRYKGPAGLARFGVALFPTPDLVVWLDAPAEEVTRRKPELTVEEARSESTRWANLPVRRLLRVDASRPTSEFVGRILAAAHLGGGYFGFPPGKSLVAIPRRRRGAILPAMTLYAGCRPSVVSLQLFLTKWEQFLGGRYLPLTPTDLPDWPELEDWADLLGACKEVTGDFDTVTFARRRQPSRPALAMLLLSAGRAVGFVKARQAGGDGLSREFAALEMVSSAGTSEFQVPCPWLQGATAGLEYMITEPLPVGVHTLIKNPRLSEIQSDLSRSLAELRSEAEKPDHWVPIHGDLAPWNLRRMADGSVFLLDWEDASWGPPGADAAYYRATASMLGLPYDPVPVGAEVESFWLERLSQRLAAASRAGDPDLAAIRQLTAYFERSKHR